jgi:hypothetical protein
MTYLQGETKRIEVIDVKGLVKEIIQLVEHAYSNENEGVTFLDYDLERLITKSIMDAGMKAAFDIAIAVCPECHTRAVVLPNANCLCRCGRHSFPMLVSV